MKAVVIGTKTNGEKFRYTLEVSSVTYINGNVIILKADGEELNYQEAIAAGYKYTISITD